MKPILALDIATVTGWATNANSVMKSGHKRFGGKGKVEPGVKFYEFSLWLDVKLERLEPELIVYEMPHFRGNAATLLCVGLVTRVIEAASKNNIGAVGVHSGKLKKFAALNGKASKEEMIDAAIRFSRRYREKAWTRENYDRGGDEADAICLLKFAMERILK